MARATVTVIGGTGFLGSSVVRQLRSSNVAVRVASRHPQRVHALFGEDSGIEAVNADIHDEGSLRTALSGASGVVNAVSLYVERGRETFHTVHVEGARRLAAIAARSGVGRVVLISGIGSDTSSKSTYIASRGQGEDAVRSEFPGATILRPSVLFGPGDAFLSQVIGLLRRLPLYPLFGRGETRLQPAYVEDVAAAAAAALDRDDTSGVLFECVGPRIYTYRELMESIARAAQARSVLIPVPFGVWHLMARMAELLPNPPLARNQVELMEIDSVGSEGARGLADLGIHARSIEEILPAMLARR